MLLVSGFSIEGLWWLYPLAAVISFLTVLAFEQPWCKKHGKILVVLGLIIWLVLVVLLESHVRNGAARLYEHMLWKVNQVYHEQQAAALPGGNLTDTGILLLLALALIACYLSFAVVIRNRFLLAAILLLPLLTVTAMFGGAQNAAALFLILFGALMSLSLEQSVLRTRMMGGSNRKLSKKNMHRWQHIRTKSAILVFVSAIVISIPGYLLARPILNISLSPAETYAMKLRSDVLSKLIEVLPKMTAGAYQLEVETTGGGVLDGALQDTKGDVFRDLEDLSLTLSKKPAERIYLRGFIGSTYQNNEWKMPYESSFDAAAMNWNLDTDASLMIQNLPFLRCAYVLNEGADTSAEPMEITVERINANERYTYVPYGAYLNDYYEIANGDGPVKGQNAKDDQYLFYSSEELERILTEWNQREDTANMLDRLEESYRAFCKGQYLEIADGLSSLEEEVHAVKEAHHWNEEEHLGEITTWIRTYLNERYRYDRGTETIPEGEDFLTRFLFETKKGYSIHFASAAVELYRMFGVPARYVVGYEAPESIFAVQQDGTYTAVLEDDNSQAWAEIYVSGIGWKAEDLTPGTIGTLEEAGEDAQAIVEYKDAVAQSPNEQKQTPLPKAPTVLKSWTLRDMIRGFASLTVGILGLFGLYRLILMHVIVNGYDPFGKRGTQKRALGIFRAIDARLHRLGLANEIDSESEEYISFAETCLKNSKAYHMGDLKRLLDRLYASCYGNETLTDEDVAAFRTLYRQLPHRMSTR